MGKSSLVQRWDILITDLVNDFLVSNPQYVSFSMEIIKRGYTPIFEFCSNRARIVIEYPEERLVLTGIRSTLYGDYIEYEKLKEIANEWNIEVVKAYSYGIDNFDDFLTHTQNLKGEEGYVIRFFDGTMIKMKGDEYCQFHKILGRLINEKDIVELIVQQKIDDCISILNHDVKERIIRFQNDIMEFVVRLSNELFTVATNNKHLDRKTFALQVASTPENKNFSSILFRAYSNEGVTVEDVVNMVLSQIERFCSSSTKLDENRKWINDLKFSDYCQKTIRME